RFLCPATQVVRDLGLVPEIPGQHRVHVGELKGVVALDNSFGSRPMIEGMDDAFEQDACADHAQAALSVIEQWHRNSLDWHVQGRVPRALQRLNRSPTRESGWHPRFTARPRQ